MNIGVVAGVFFSGEAVESVSGSSSIFIGGFFFRVTSVHSVFFFSWAFSVSFWVPLVSLLMMAVEAVVAAVSVAAVAAFGGFFPGQNFEICPSCLQLQLPLPAKNYLRDGLEALLNQTKPEHVVPVGRPGS